jgi:hypothetical protein
MMHAVEFQATIKDGIIEIPEEYRDELGEQVRVIVLSNEKSSRPNLIDQLLERPWQIEGLKPLTRDEIYER